MSPALRDPCLQTRPLCAHKAHPGHVLDFIGALCRYLLQHAHNPASLSSLYRLHYSSLSSSKFDRDYLNADDLCNAMTILGKKIVHYNLHVTFSMYLEGLFEDQYASSLSRNDRCLKLIRRCIGNVLLYDTICYNLLGGLVPLGSGSF